MTTTLFHTLAFADVERGISFLKALGFTEKGVYRDEQDPSVVLHAQFDWRESGGVMFGSSNPDDPHTSGVGQARCYLVVAEDADVDDVHARALAAGGSTLREPADMGYGGRGSTVVDPEGNQWSIGSYPGE